MDADKLIWLSALEKNYPFYIPIPSLTKNLPHLYYLYEKKFVDLNVSSYGMNYGTNVTVDELLKGKLGLITIESVKIQARLRAEGIDLIDRLMEKAKEEKKDITPPQHGKLEYYLEHVKDWTSDVVAKIVAEMSK